MATIGVAALMTVHVMAQSIDQPSSTGTSTTGTSGLSSSSDDDSLTTTHIVLLAVSATFLFLVLAYFWCFKWWIARRVWPHHALHTHPRLLQSYSWYLVPNRIVLKKSWMRRSLSMSKSVIESKPKSVKLLKRHEGKNNLRNDDKTMKTSNHTIHPLTCLRTCYICICHV